MSNNRYKQKILILFAHPAQHHSHANLAMAKVAKSIENVTFVDLYEQYPRLKIDVEAEQERLRDHDIIIFQFPIYWYSTPSILKEWQDLVLEYGFAYGHNGVALKDKKFMCAVTAGVDAQSYSKDGNVGHSLRELLLPIEKTAKLCNMNFLPPFALHASIAAQHNGEIETHAQQYGELLNIMSNNQLDTKNIDALEYINISAIPTLNEA